MATAEQLKMLIKSHFEREPERFATLALQVAAHEARQGHSALANEIRVLIEQAKENTAKVIPINRDFEDLVISSRNVRKLSELIVSDEIHKRIQRIIREFRQREKLRGHGLDHRRKILLAGPPGTGKTMTANILASELQLPFFTILMDKLVTKFMGETSAKLRQIFNIIQGRRGIYLFDEFDAIGAERGRDDDVGEMRRVLNSFLQFIEQDSSESLIIAATNNHKILDHALFRRFDDVLHLQLPTFDEICKLINNRLGAFKNATLEIQRIAKKAERLSHAEITFACDDAIKESILDDQETVTEKLLLSMIEDRHSAYHDRTEK